MQLEKKFKHAKEVGVRTPRSAKAFDEFESALRAFVANAGTEFIDGECRRFPAHFYYSPTSRIVVVQHLDGRFWTLFVLRPLQLMHLLRDGRLGGG